MPCSCETEDEDAKNSWQQDEFHVMLWPWSQDAVNKKFSWLEAWSGMGEQQQ